MKLNCIQLRTTIDGLIDRINSPRYTDYEYYEAINIATTRIFEDRVDNVKVQKSYSFESVQRLRDELYTLIKTVTAAPVANVIPYPVDYNYTIGAEFTVGTTTQSARAISYNELGLIQRNPFKQLSPEQTFYIEQANGLLGLFDGGTFSQYTLWYLKNPATVSIGNQSDKLIQNVTNPVTLVIGTIYIAYDQTTYNSTTFYPGDVFTGIAPNTFTSGTVIPRSVTVDSDMPDKILPEICTLAGSILSGTVEDYNKKQSLLQDQSSQ